jgi:hypothetical protein
MRLPLVITRSSRQQARANCEASSEIVWDLGVYDRHGYREEKRRAFEALAQQIERIVNPQPSVVPMRSGAGTSVA